MPLSSNASPLTSPRPSGAKILRDLPLDVREQIGDVLGCEADVYGFGEGEEPNAYGVELGELFDALGL